MSGVFAVLSPLPLLFFFARAGWFRLFLAAVANTVLVHVAMGTVSSALYLGAVGLVSLILPYFLVLKRKKFEVSVFLTVISVLVIAFGLVGLAAAVQGVNLVAWFKTWVTDVIQMLRAASPQNLSEIDLASDEFRRRVVVEFPSLIGVFTLILVWVNATLFLRLNPMYLRQRIGVEPGFARTWKNPEWFVWVVIGSGAFYILEVPVAREISLNLLKFLLAAYVIQGLAILGSALDSWKVFGIFRLFLFVFVVVLLMPLLLGLGFFDLWFDFRSKLRQS